VLKGCLIWIVGYQKNYKLFGNKYKIHLLSLSPLKQLWNSSLFYYLKSKKKKKTKAESKVFLKLYYLRAAISERKKQFLFLPLWLTFGLLHVKAVAKKLNQTEPFCLDKQNPMLAPAFNDRKNAENLVLYI
jgi:hypothetical protein